MFIIIQLYSDLCPLSCFSLLEILPFKKEEGQAFKTWKQRRLKKQYNIDRCLSSLAKQLFFEANCSIKRRHEETGEGRAWDFGFIFYSEV
ncbi:hypothetical protein M5K25_027146 [Dendrobium thyrsiflorum]|uniref:Uncharacterized protein n=1 Tax=Dendrobium thyrsiflorum TaxID=117978 RepID=A0ABD0TZG3_DENTH